MADQDQAIEQEAQELHSQMQALADQWRKKLAEPAMQQQIRARTVVVSPLVQQLLTAFPPKGFRPTTQK